MTKLYKQTKERFRRVALQSIGYVVSVLGFALTWTGVTKDSQQTVTFGLTVIGIGLILSAVGYAAHVILLRK